MKGKFLVPFFLALLTSTAAAFAADSPISLTHKLTASQKGTSATTLTFSLHLENRSDRTLTNLALSFMSFPPYTTRGANITLQTLGPHQSVDSRLVVAASPSQDPNELAYRPLFFTGKYSTEGRSLDFPAVCQPMGRGGAK
jgi:hypothetical protein